MGSIERSVVSLVGFREWQPTVEAREGPCRPLQRQAAAILTIVANVSIVSSHCRRFKLTTRLWLLLGAVSRWIDETDSLP